MPSRFIIGAIAAFSVALPVSAQVTTQTPPPDALTTVITTAIADVNLGDVSVKEDKGTWSGSFTLLGRLGLQANLVYGVVAYDTARHIVDFKKLGEEATLREGELKHYTFTYIPPASLKGEVTFRLEAYTPEGLLVGVQTFGKKVFSGTGNPVLCDTKKEGTSCTAARATSVSISRFEGSFLTTPLESRSRAVKTSETFTLSSLFGTLKPGMYLAAVGEAGGAMSVYPLKIAGAYASIQNIVVAKEEAAIHAVGFVTGTAKDLTAKIAFTPTSGASCDTVEAQIVGHTFDITLKPTCTEGTLALSVVGKDGTSYDSASTAFSVVSVATTDGTAPSANQAQASTSPYTLFAILVLVVLGAAYGIYFWQKRNQSTMIPPTTPPTIPTALILFLFASSFFVAIPRVSALTLYSRVFDAGEIAHECQITIQGNSNTGYYAGGTMTLTADTNVWVDVPPSGYNAWGCSVAWRPDSSHSNPSDPLYDAGNTLLGGAPAWGLVSANRVMDTWLGDSKVEDYTFPIYGNMTPGLHTLTLRLLLSTSNFQSGIANANWEFTVVAPTVQVFFSTP